MELQLDTCDHWLEIALEHLAAAKSAHDALLEAKASGNEFGPWLDREFKSSLQVAVASATFFEALYAATIDRVTTKPPSHVPGERRGQSRYAKVAEQLRMSFGLRNVGTANLRSVLKVIYGYRDEAVHPSSNFEEPVAHPDLLVGVERRFVTFAFDCAHEIVRGALAFSRILPSRDMSKRPKGMQELAKYLLEVCAPLYQLWQHTYGDLFDKEE